MNKIVKLLSSKRRSSDFEEELDQSNSIEISISNIENRLQNWSIPKQDFKTIYEIGTFEFLSSYSIKTTEKTIPLLQNHQDIQLFSEKSIKEYRKFYKYLHIGLIQVAVKPLTRIGIDAPICIILRDARLLNFKQSLLSLAESNICNGPIYFNCYPNYTVSLLDRNILDVLTLSIKTQNIKMKEGSDPLVVIYRVYYKMMTTTIEPRAKIISPKNETLIFEANLENSKVCIPKRLKWNEITRNQTWKLEEYNQIKPLKLNENISNITEFTDGNVEITFGESSRHSTYIPESSNNMSDDNIYFKKSQSMRFKGVDFNHSIPKPLYEEDNKSDNFSDNYKPSEIDNYENIN